MPLWPEIITTGPETKAHGEKQEPTFPKISGNGSQSAGSGNRIVPQSFNFVASIMMRRWTPWSPPYEGRWVRFGFAVRAENNGQEPNYVSAIWCRAAFAWPEIVKNQLGRRATTQCMSGLPPKTDFAGKITA